MRTLGERVELFLQDRMLDLSANTSYPILPCAFCGEENKKGERVDTEFDFLTTTNEKDIESFCIRCWFMNLLRGT